MMTNEEVWKVIDEKFKGVAKYDDGCCVYLMRDGRKCAIGLFIPDGHEAQKHSGVFGCLFRDFPDLIKEMPTENPFVLGEWQLFHDKILDKNAPLKEQKAALFNHYIKLQKVYNVNPN